MPELELELRELGSRIAYPHTPDLAAAVRRRLTAEPRRRTLPVRRALVLGFALLAVAIGAVMAVPQARTAILEWLGLRGATIERVPTQPTAPPPETADLGLGERVTLVEAREQAGFRVLRPRLSELVHPDEIYLSSLTTGGQVAFVDRADGRVRLLLTEFQGALNPDFIQKSAGPETTIERVQVNGEPGYWLAGKPHEFVYTDENGQPVFETVRLAGNTLLWENGDLLLRLEGDLTRAEALGIARSAR
jgi:hypothetical protein